MPSSDECSCTVFVLTWSFGVAAAVWRRCRGCFRSEGAAPSEEAVRKSNDQVKKSNGTVFPGVVCVRDLPTRSAAESFNERQAEYWLGTSIAQSTLIGPVREVTYPMLGH